MADQMTISLESFTQALREASLSILPWVKLVPTTTPSSEVIRPTLTDPVPSVMTSFEAVPDASYQWSYKQVMYVRMHYFLERDGQFEVGILHAFHNNGGTLVSSMSSEVSRPSLSSADFSAPTFYIYRENTYRTGSDLGVSFSLSHISTSSGEDPKFGLDFKITSATPSVFPRFAAAISSAFSPPS